MATTDAAITIIKCMQPAFENLSKQVDEWFPLINEWREKRGKLSGTFNFDNLMNINEKYRKLFCLQNIYALYINRLYMDYAIIIRTVVYINNLLPGLSLELQQNNFNDPIEINELANDLHALFIDLQSKLTIDLETCKAYDARNFDEFIRNITTYFKHTCSKYETSDASYWITFYIS